MIHLNEKISTAAAITAIGDRLRAIHKMAYDTAPAWSEQLMLRISSGTMGESYVLAPRLGLVPIGVPPMREHCGNLPITNPARDAIMVRARDFQLAHSVSVPSIVAGDIEEIEANVRVNGVAARRQPARMLCEALTGERPGVHTKPMYLGDEQAAFGWHSLPGLPVFTNTIDGKISTALWSKVKQDMAAVDPTIVPNVVIVPSVMVNPDMDIREALGDPNMTIVVTDDLPGGHIYAVCSQWIVKPFIHQERKPVGTIYCFNPDTNDMIFGSHMRGEVFLSAPHLVWRITVRS